MEVLYPRCAGLDVHKKTVVACRVQTAPSGHTRREIRSFGTTTGELLALLDWLHEWDCTHAALESTGEYWKPVYFILEGTLDLLLVNPAHMRAVPGRKTDVKDSEWLAELLRHGLLRASFVPPPEQRDLRDLTRQRGNLVRERASVVNRLQKVLESANIKLASVATDVLGVSGRAILQELIAGNTDAASLAELARGRLRAKRAELAAALEGRVRTHHRFLLLQHLEHIDFLDEQIAAFDQAIQDHLAGPVPPLAEGSAVPDPPASGAATGTARPGEPVSYARAVEVVDSYPGIEQRLAESLVAEMGRDMSRFPSARHFAAWAGVAPGNHASAGKQYSGRSRPGNAALRQALVQAAHGAKRTKGTYAAAQYQRLAGRRGAKRAIVAVAHSIAVALYHMVGRNQLYEELGGNYLDERKRESVVNRLVHRLEKLGYHVGLESQPARPVVAA
jgi:transposase